MIAGVIGYKNHSEKVINILCLNYNIKKIKVFLHKKINSKNFLYSKNKKIIFTYSLKELDIYECIFITSPTNTHFKYLKNFEKSKEY